MNTITLPNIKLDMNALNEKDFNHCSVCGKRCLWSYDLCDKKQCEVKYLKLRKAGERNMVRDIDTGKKIADVKRWNQIKHDIQLLTLGGLIIGLTILGFYVKPRINAYMNAVRVAHTSPEAVESLRVNEINKKGTFTISLTK